MSKAITLDQIDKALFEVRTQFPYLFKIGDIQSVIFHNYGLGVTIAIDYAYQCESVHCVAARYFKKLFYKHSIITEKMYLDFDINGIDFPCRLTLSMPVKEASNA